MTLGETIRDYRQDKDMKQSELTKKVFVNHCTISNYENNASMPDFDIMVRIAKALEVDLEVFSKAVSNIG